MTVPILGSRSIAVQDLFVRALDSTYRLDWRVYPASYAELREPDAYEKACRDPIVKSGMDMRFHKIAGQRWTIQPGDDRDSSKRVAAIIEQMIRRYCRRFTEGRYRLAQAIVRGMSWEFTGTERRRCGFDGIEAEWLVPTYLKDVDNRRFRLWSHRSFGAKSSDQTLTTTWQMYSVARMRWEQLETPELFITTRYGDEEARLGYGRGLLESIYFYLWAKGILWQLGLQAIENWSQGIAIGSIQGLRDASVSKTNETLRDDWLAALHAMRETGEFVMDKEDGLELKPGPAGEGIGHVQSWIKYIDDALTRTLTGSLLPFGGGDAGGSLARAETESDSSESLFALDTMALDEACTAGIVQLLFRRNWPIFSAAGLGDAEIGRLVTSHRKVFDTTKEVSVAAAALAAGIKLKPAEVYERIGYTQPAPGEEVLERSASPFPEGNIPGFGLPNRGQ